VVLLVAMLLLFVLALLGLSLYFSARQARARLDLILRVLEKGHSVPAELFHGRDDPPMEALQRRDLRRGVGLLACGLGAALALYLVTWELRATAWALIFFFLSVGSFANWYLSRKLDGRKDRVGGA
jgi:hypothetical protein